MTLAEMMPGSAPDEFVDDDSQIQGLDDGEPQGPVPYERFEQVNNQLKEERDARVKLETRLDELVGKLASGTPPAPPPGRPASNPALSLENLPTPPEGLSQLQAAYWHIDKGIERRLADHLKSLGLDIDSLREYGSRLPQLASSSAERVWSDLCSTVELDPSNEVVRSAFINLTQSGKSNEEAIKLIKSQMGGSQTRRRTATPMTSGFSGGPTVGATLPRDKAQAGAMAARGQLAPDVGIFDVLKRRQ